MTLSASNAPLAFFAPFHLTNAGHSYPSLCRRHEHGCRYLCIAGAAIWVGVAKVRKNKLDCVALSHETTRDAFFFYAVVVGFPGLTAAHCRCNQIDVAKCCKCLQPVQC